jgi:integrase
MAAVKLDTTNVAAALAFIILAGVRIGEAVNATWAEIDFPGRLWTIPAERMGKTDEEHRVPLSGPALEILRLMAQRKSNTNDFVFQAKYGDKVMNRSGVQVALKRIRPGVTVHGFRTTFRTWCADHDRPREHAEMSLAHLVGSAVERSYQRSDLLDKRRKLMEDWGNYVTGRTF